MKDGKPGGPGWDPGDQGDQDGTRMDEDGPGWDPQHEGVLLERPITTGKPGWMQALARPRCSAMGHSFPPTSPDPQEPTTTTPQGQHPLLTTCCLAWAG